MGSPIDPNDPSMMFFPEFTTPPKRENMFFPDRIETDSKSEMQKASKDKVQTAWEKAIEERRIEDDAVEHLPGYPSKY